MQTFLESEKYSQRLHTMSIETMIKWTEQKSLNTGFDMFLNDDICYSWYWWLHQVNTLYQPDVKDLMPGILIAWCDGALNAVMVEMVMMIILSCLWLLCCCCWWISWAWWCPWWWFNEQDVDSTFLWPGRWGEPKDLTWGDHRQASLQLCPTWQSQAWPYRISDEYWIL